MMIIKLYSNRKEFEDVCFHDGLNVVLGETPTIWGKALSVNCSTFVCSRRETIIFSFFRTKTSSKNISSIWKSN